MKRGGCGASSLGWGVCTGRVSVEGQVVHVRPWGPLDQIHTDCTLCMLLKATFQQPLHICFLLAQPWFLQPYCSDLACTLAEVDGSLLGTCQVAELMRVTDFLEFGRAEQPSWGIGLVQALQSPDPQSALL